MTNEHDLVASNESGTRVGTRNTNCEVYQEAT